jgi:quercetin dioxygenase-like cupin family protein
MAAIGLEMTTNNQENTDMAEPQKQGHPLRGRTTGTPQNPARQVAAPVLAFDLPAEIERLHQEAGWIGGERAGKTLVKEPDFRIVLTAMKSGTRLAHHEADARVSIHVLTGQLVVHIQDHTTEMSAGHVLVLERNIPHDVDALVDCAFLLTLAWPERPEDALPGSSV